MRYPRIALIILFCALIAHPAFSSSFGLFGTGGYGKTDYLRAHEDEDIYKVDYSAHGALYGGGLIFNTGGAEESYRTRMQIVFEGMSPRGGTYSFTRAFRGGFNSVFAFRAAGDDKFAFWIGPLIGIHYLTSKYKTTRNEEWGTPKKRWFFAANIVNPSLQPYSIWYYYFDPMWKRTHGGGFQAGIAMGFDIGLTQQTAVTIEAGFRCGIIYLIKPGFNYEGYLAAGCLFGR